MSVPSEGEILWKEKYGSRQSMAYQTLYVKPPDQSNVVILYGKKGGLGSDVASNMFTKIFLPQGYPDSVSKDYLPYQIWDTAQAFCSTISGTLSTQEVLKGVGVGDAAASPLAATTQVIFKDACGHIGRILFAYTHGTQLDAYSKKWRLYADTLNDAAMCIEIALPLFKDYITFALCVSSVMRAIVGVAGGATRSAMTQHHAIRGNMADVSAKDSAQETAVNLLASVTALVLLNTIGNSLMLFILMVVLHIVFNYFAVRAVCLRTFNEPRFLQVINAYLSQEVILSTCKVNQMEPIIFYSSGFNMLAFKWTGFKIKMGCSLDTIVRKNSKLSYLAMINRTYEKRQYLLFPDTGSREMFVTFKEEATTDDILYAYFHAALLSLVICAINDEELPTISVSRPFAEICHTLQSSAWTRTPTKKIGMSGFLHAPTEELLKYIDSIVEKEWIIVRQGLKNTGWDCSKHLLKVDEWRITKEDCSPQTADIVSHK